MRTGCKLKSASGLLSGAGVAISRLLKSKPKLRYFYSFVVFPYIPPPPPALQGKIWSLHQREALDLRSGLRVCLDGDSNLGGSFGRGHSEVGRRNRGGFLMFPFCSESVPER